MTRGPVWIHHYSDGVVKVVLDRPEKANALSATMLEALIAAMLTIWAPVGAVRKDISPVTNRQDAVGG